MRRGSVLAAVLLGVGVGSLRRVVRGVHRMAVGDRRMVGGVVGLPRIVVGRRLLMMLGGLTVVFSGLLVVVRSFLCHTVSSGLREFSVSTQLWILTLILHPSSPLI